MKLTEGAISDIVVAIKYFFRNILPQILYPRADEVKNNPVINPPEPNKPPVTIKTQSTTSKIPIWAVAISKQEGDFPGSKSRTNNNPGNIKSTLYTTSLGSIGHDDKNFCKFPSWNAGMSALEHFLTDACSNRLLSYKSTMTLSQFTRIYAQPPGIAYETGVAKALGVSTQTPIGDLL